MTSQEYGFFYGKVHGFISPFVLIAKLQGAHIGLYAVHNSGTFYWLGYVLGFVFLLGSGGGGVASRNKYQNFQFPFSFQTFNS
jgi:hypothetical protein